jgi:hypothetical protein
MCFESQGEVVKYGEEEGTPPEPLPDGSETGDGKGEEEGIPPQPI